MVLFPLQKKTKMSVAFPSGGDWIGLQTTHFISNEKTFVLKIRNKKQNLLTFRIVEAKWETLKMG